MRGRVPMPAVVIGHSNKAPAKSRYENYSRISKSSATFPEPPRITSDPIPTILRPRHVYPNHTSQSAPPARNLHHSHNSTRVSPQTLPPCPTPSSPAATMTRPRSQQILLRRTLLAPRRLCRVSQTLVCSNLRERPQALAACASMMP